MTLDQLIIKTVTLQVMFVILKVLFFGFLNVESYVILGVYYLVLAAMSVAVVRRIGALNYLEAFLVMFLWLIVALATDYLVTANLAGSEIYNDGHFWWSYLVVLLAILLFHKKVHVEVRKGHISR